MNSPCMSNKKLQPSSKVSNNDFEVILKECTTRIGKVTNIIDTKLSRLTRHFCAILSVCDNIHNLHFAENALNVFCFIAYEIEALNFGYMSFQSQERSFQGFLSSQTGSFDSKSNKRDSGVRLTSCCVENLALEAKSNGDLLNQIDVLKMELRDCSSNLHVLSEKIVSALAGKNRGKGGFKFVFNVKHFGFFRYTSECSADMDAQGRKIPRGVDGYDSLKTCLDVSRRDMYNEIDNLHIVPLELYPHGSIIAAESALEEVEKAQAQEAKVAYQRRCEANAVIAQRREQEKQRKRELVALAAADVAAKEAQSVTSPSSGDDDEEEEDSVTDSRGGSILVNREATVSSKDRSASSADDEEVSDDGSDSDLGFTLSDYKGDDNDLEHRGRNKRPVQTGNFDLLKGDDYDKMDEQLINNLRNGGVPALTDFILRAGNVAPGNVLGHGRLGQKVSRPISSQDDAWSESASGGSNRTHKSQLDSFVADDCEGMGPSKSLLVSNSIDRGFSSDDEAAVTRRKKKATIAVAALKADKQSKKRNKTSTSKSSHKPVSRGYDSDAGFDEAAILASSDSDAPKKKRKKQPTKTATDRVSENADENDDGDVVRKAREVISLSEKQLAQYANVNLVPLQLPVEFCRNEQFEVDGKMMSEEELKQLIFDDVETISGSVDTRFLSFVREHIMVEVFKDVYFMTNVISYYRSKRFLHGTAAGQNIICEWEVVLSRVAAELIDELVASNKKILEIMDANLRELKDSRKEKRAAIQRMIISDEEATKNDLDFADLEEYRNQIKLNKKSMEDLEKVAKRRINSLAHSIGAKIACIWAKLNNYQHLLSGNMSKFEKKFLLDPSMPYYSVLSDDLSRRWGNVVTNPAQLFPGVDLTGSNIIHNADLSSVVQQGVSSYTSSSPRIAQVSSIEELALNVAHFPDNSGQSMTAETEREALATNDEQKSQRDLSSPALGCGVTCDGILVSSVSLVERSDNIDGSSSSFSSPQPSSLTSSSLGTLRPSKDVYSSTFLRDLSPASLTGSAKSSQNGETIQPSPITLSTPTASATLIKSRAPHMTVNRTSTGGSQLTSYLSSSARNTPGRNGFDDGLVSNAAVLFDELKHMSNDSKAVDGMVRFIEVMNVKAPHANMPGTKAEEDKLLDKANAKKAKAAAGAGANKKADADKNNTSPTSTAALRSDDELETNGDGAVRVVHKTESYSYFQDLFLFFTRKHIEVKDKNMNLQFFGERLVRTLKNNTLLKFLLMLLRDQSNDPNSLAIAFLYDKSIFAEFKCYFGVAFREGDYFNILGDGYCVLRCMFALHSNEKLGYKLTAAEMKLADSVLFNSIKTRREFHSFLVSTRESVSIHCNDQVTKDADKKKLRTLVTLFGAYPQLKQVPAAYWACLDWVSYAPFNCTAFSTNYSECVPGYAQMHCSSAIRRGAPSTDIGLVPFSLEEVYHVLTVPPATNFCVLEGQHAFVVKGPSRNEMVDSFMDTLRLFMSVCLKGVGLLKEKFTVLQLAEVDEIAVKMVADNLYTLKEKEAEIMTSVGKCIQELDASFPHRQVVTADGFQSTVLPVNRSNGPRDNEEVIDLCDSDTGDVDRVIIRSVKAKTTRSDQELTLLKFKFEASERENKFLLRLIEKDSDLMHQPPLDFCDDSL